MAFSAPKNGGSTAAFNAIWKYFQAAYGRNVIHELHYKECIDYLHEKNVEYIVYSNYAHKKGMAKGLNGWNLKVLEEYPELYCFAAYHPDDDDALGMARSLLDHPRILGFKLQLLVQMFYPHDERLFPLYEMVIEKGKRLLLHVGNGPIGNSFVGIDNFIKLLEKYPDLPANVAHMGGFEYGEFIRLLDHFPNICLDTTWAFLPQSGFMFDQKKEVLEAHKNRIIYGSDFPILSTPERKRLTACWISTCHTIFTKRCSKKTGLHSWGNRVKWGKLSLFYLYCYLTLE